MKAGIDSCGRSIRYLRVSLTEACSYGCIYCKSDTPSHPRTAPPLSPLEINRMIRAFSMCGIEKIRFTGGEPMLRDDLVEIIRSTCQVPGIRRLALTTNGQRLSDLASILHSAGLQCLNISINTLRPDRYHAITGTPNLQQALNGIDAALRAGFREIKLNVVLMNGVNEDEFDDFVRFSKNLPVQVRFIELMQTEDNSDTFRKHALHLSPYLNLLQQQGWTPSRAHDPLDGPSRVLTHPEYRSGIGFILPYTGNFCASCNRLRVDSLGRLSLCLFSAQPLDLRPHLIRDEAAVALPSELLKFIRQKPPAHALQDGMISHHGAFHQIGG